MAIVLGTSYGGLEKRRIGEWETEKLRIRKPGMQEGNGGENAETPKSRLRARPRVKGCDGFIGRFGVISIGKSACFESVSCWFGISSVSVCCEPGHFLQKKTPGLKIAEIP
ncbi:MAG: hypothetical protein IPK83_01075 [Planctomycetes bacterium]|nr:hypothetical protein [Planctomycetota bacterium]